MKPIEPGCVCILIDAGRATGRMVCVVRVAPHSEIWDKARVRRLKGTFWWVRSVAGTLPVWAYRAQVYKLSTGEVIAHESQLRRLDDDDTAEPRITEREIEHA